MVSRGNNSPINLFWAVMVSSFVALVLMLIQLPSWMFYFWPDWIALVVVYWALVTPNRFGPVMGFIIGTLLEVVFVRKFGVLGLGLAVLAFIVNSSHQQLRVLSMWQQMILVGVGVFKLITGWFYGLVTDFTITTEYWYSLIGCVVIWPFAFILLQELRRITRVK